MQFPQLAFAESPAKFCASGASATAPRGGPPGPKIILYSHDTFGLGNIRRTLLLAEALREEFPSAAILILTGSPVIQSFRIPEGVDYIKLPCLDRVDADRYEPRYLGACAAEVKATRRALLINAVLGFVPDLMIVDKRPTGVDGELAATLELLRARHPSTKLVLGIRDILDAPEQTRLSLERSGAFASMERYYDEVWIYGAQELFDPIVEYGFPQAVADRTEFCGYLRRPTKPAASRSGPPRVLVTTGGSGDGGDVVQAYLEGLVDLPRRLTLRSTIVFGPHLIEGRRSAILDRYGELSDVEFIDFEPDLTNRYANADVVVSMAGYNAVCEILSFGVPAVLVPRAQPVQEQLIRSRLLASRGLCDYVEPHELEPGVLMEKVLRLLHGETALSAETIDLGGLPRVLDRCRSLLAMRAARGSVA